MEVDKYKPQHFFKKYNYQNLKKFLNRQIFLKQSTNNYNKTSNLLKLNQKQIYQLIKILDN